MNKIIEASKFILDQTNFNGQTGFILGSGLGGFTDVLTKKRILKYSKIPNYPQTMVEGHKGELIIGKLDHKDILVANGRFHFYEGHSIKNILFPIRVFKECGLKNLIITNSAGSLKKENPPGTIMIIDGHINCTFQDSLDDPKIIKDRKFHSLELHAIAKEVAFENDISKLIVNEDKKYILIRADKDIKYGEVVYLLDIIRKFKNLKIAVSTEPK